MIVESIKRVSLVLLCIAGYCHGSPLKSDETVFFFPTSANLDNNSNWNVPIHHWVFEKEENSITHKLTQELFSEITETMDLTSNVEESAILKKRLMWFLVDNERNKKIKISFNNESKIATLNLTAPNGHAMTSLSLPITLSQDGWLNYKVVNDNRLFKGSVQLIPETGLSIISDIDDTIKISNVLDKKELLKNTFIKPYQVTKGMPEYYKKLKNNGAYFHYVSASPWQLYPSLKPFMHNHYPSGSVSLRNFRLKDSSSIKFLQSSVDYKTKQIISIIKRYPKHQFILIGDSGEHDSEVYAGIYEQFPQNIKSIEIRVVKGSNIRSERFNTTFKNIPKDKWRLFVTPSDS